MTLNKLYTNMLLANKCKQEKNQNYFAISLKVLKIRFVNENIKLYLLLLRDIILSLYITMKFREER